MFFKWYKWYQITQSITYNICNMQNALNTGKDSQTDPKEIIVTKLFDNGEILTLNNKILSDEPPSDNPIWFRSIEEQLIKFWEKNYEQYLQYKGSSTKTLEKDESIPSPICINATEVNDNVTTTKNENYPCTAQKNEVFH